jgi:hypothetical protein
MTYTLACSPMLALSTWRAFAASLNLIITHINRGDPIIFGEHGSGPPTSSKRETGPIACNNRSCLY